MKLHLPGFAVIFAVILAFEPLSAVAPPKPKTTDTPISTPTNHPHSPLMQAAQDGDEAMVEALLADGADVNYVQSYLNWHPTALFTAIQERHFNVARRLIEAGANVNLRNRWGWTPLMLAAQAGDVPTAELLLAKGADVNAAMSLGKTPIIFACSTSLEMVELIAGAGADLQVRDRDGETVLSIASMNKKDSGVLKWALQQEVVRAMVATEEGFKALCGAAAAAPQNVGLLLEAGAKLETEGSRGRQLFYNACLGGDASLLRAMLDNGADPNFRMQGRTPLHAAVDAFYYPERPEAVAVLLAAGADVHAKDDKGRTPLVEAMTCGRFTEKRLETIKLLLDAGADPNDTLQWGVTSYTVLEFAKTYGFQQAAELMEAKLKK